MSRFKSWIFASVALCGLGFGPAQAATFCAATGNQVNQFLSIAEGNGEDDIIKIEQGTLTTDAAAINREQWGIDVMPETELSYSLTISGGWSKGNNCATQSSKDPTATVLDARYWGPTFAFYIPRVNGTGFSRTFSISNLTFARGKTYDVMSSGLFIQVDADVGASVIVDNVFVTTGVKNAANPNHPPAVFIHQSGSGFVRFRNSIVYANQIDNGGVDISTANAAVAYVTNNTIFGNTATALSSGMSFHGVGTLSNNAVAGNTSSSAVSYQFYSEAPTGMTLRNNHFQTKAMLNGAPAIETGTTTGDPMWTLTYVTPIPNAGSPLRDSGMNSPPGGIPSIDFDGNARVLNGTIDRGAVEHAAPPPVGPDVTPLSPTNNSTTTFLSGNVGDFKNVPLTFSVSGGSNLGTTQLSCIKTAGTVSTLSNSSQTISVGGSAANVGVFFSYTASPQTGTVQCTATPQGGTAATYTYFFQVPAGNAQGPVIVATSPAAGSTTTLTPLTAGQIVESSIQFSATGGQTGASSTIDCVVSSGTAVISANAAQAVGFNQQPLPIGVAFEATTGSQSAQIDCTITRQNVAGSTSATFHYVVEPAAAVFANSFE